MGRCFHARPPNQHQCSYSALKHLPVTTVENYDIQNHIFFTNHALYLCCNLPLPALSSSPKNISSLLKCGDFLRRGDTFIKHPVMKPKVQRTPSGLFSCNRNAISLTSKRLRPLWVEKQSDLCTHHTERYGVWCERERKRIKLAGKNNCIYLNLFTFYWCDAKKQRILKPRHVWWGFQINSFLFLKFQNNINVTEEHVLC